MKSIEISKQYEGERADKICFKVLKQANKSFVFKMFRKKNIVLNGKKIKGDELCQVGDVLEFYFSDETFNKFSGITSSELSKQKQGISSNPLGKMRIIYEDEYVLIYSKPNGVLAQPNGKNDNIVDQYKAYADAQGIIYDSILDSYGVCNRLDRNTTGLIIIGKTPLALRLMNTSIKNHQVDKRYHAIVHGHIEESVELKGYQTKDKNNQVHMTQDVSGDYIHTKIRPIKYQKKENWTLVEVQLHTGKTHQIRHHLSSISHPIIGDLKYGNKGENKYFREHYGIYNQMLHSYSYTFLTIDEPLDYLMNKEFLAPYPKEFIALLGEGNI